MHRICQVTPVVLEGREKGMAIGLDGLELPVGCGIFPHVGIAQLSKNLPQIS